MDEVSFSVYNLIYWQNPIQTGIVFGVLLSIVITFMFLSSLAAVSFWLLALLTVIGVYKLYNYVMATFLGRVHEDIFDTIFSPDLHISERQAHALANSIRANGTMLLRQGRNLFLWNNLTSSTMVRISSPLIKSHLSSSSSLLVRFGSFRLLLHWIINECLNICLGWIGLYIHHPQNLSSLSGKYPLFIDR